MLNAAGAAWGAAGFRTTISAPVLREASPKINIFTHNNLTAARAAHTHFTESVGAFELMPFITEAVKHETMHHMRVFGSDGKA